MLCERGWASVRQVIELLPADGEVDFTRELKTCVLLMSKACQLIVWGPAPGMCRLLVQEPRSGCNSMLNRYRPLLTAIDNAGPQCSLIISATRSRFRSAICSGGSNGRSRVGRPCRMRRSLRNAWQNAGLRNRS